MQDAGATEIIFIHGFELKKDVVQFFSATCHKHFLQKETGFANVLRELLINIQLEREDQVLFGMPDTVFRGNPFHQMLSIKGITCGLFITNYESKVDRLYGNKQKFAVKQSKSSSLQDWFWGVLKFEGANIIDMEAESYFSKYNEIGDILNQYDFSCINAGDYLDLGTWDNYNY
ncbi:hypothetical protein N9370_01840, partial [Paracoccaceae bacterium]|nr:hypothetical protein [Paracoccaceae bacterium]